MTTMCIGCLQQSTSYCSITSLWYVGQPATKFYFGPIQHHKDKKWQPFLGERSNSTLQTCGADCKFKQLYWRYQYFLVQIFQRRLSPPFSSFSWRSVVLTPLLWGVYFLAWNQRAKHCRNRIPRRGPIDWIMGTSWLKPWIISGMDIARSSIVRP